MDELIATGIIRGSHGVEGYVKVASLSGELEHFSSLKEVTLVSGNERTNKTVEDVRVVFNGVLMKFEGVQTPESARKFANWEIWVPRSIAAPLSEAEHYISDIVGCSVILQGERVGNIKGVVDSGAAPLFEVVLSDGTSRFIPYRDEFFGALDLESATIQLLEAWSIE